MKNYSSLFIHPLSAGAVFTEDGWRFSVPDEECISYDFVSDILGKFNLKFEEEYLSFTKFKNKKMELIVTKRKNKTIKLVMLKLYFDSKEKVGREISSQIDRYQLYLFDPEKELEKHEGG